MVTPHSGTNMIKGDFPSDFDQLYYCLQYRLGGGLNLQGNFQLDWWFYDPLGGFATNGNDSSYRDYVAINTYTTDLSTMDYPTSANQTLSGIIQRLSLGAAPNSSAGVDYNFYQARIVGCPALGTTTETSIPRLRAASAGTMAASSHWGRPPTASRLCSLHRTAYGEPECHSTPAAGDHRRLAIDRGQSCIWKYVRLFR